MLAFLKEIFLYSLEKRDVMCQVLYGAKDVGWIFLRGKGAISLEVLQERLSNIYQIL